MRILAKLIASLIILIVTALFVVVVLLHTRYSTPVFNTVSQTLLPGKLTVAQVGYHWRSPLQLTLIQPDYQAFQTDWHADKLQLYIDPATFPHIAWLRIDGMDIDLDALDANPLQKLPQGLTIGRVLLSDVTLHTPHWQATNVRAQLDNWQKGSQAYGTVKGRAQWEIGSLYGQGIALTQLLLDAKPSDQGWEILGASMQWQRAAISAQGHWQPGTLALEQLTISDAVIDSEQTRQILAQALAAWPHDTVLTVARADVRQLSAETHLLSVNQLTFSAQDLRFAPNAPWWYQPAMRLSFNADYLRWQGQTWEQPLGDIEWRDNTVIVNQLTSQLQEGFFAVSGQFTQNNWQIDRFQANGLTLSRQELDPLQDLLPGIPTQLSITSLQLKHNEWLNLSPDFATKISGIDVDGQSLEIRDGELVNGLITASANHASINQQWLAEPYLRLEAHDRKLQLHQFLLGFPDGQLALSGQINLAAPSRPWSLAVDGLQIPLSIYHAWFDWPLPLDGFHDIEGQWSGLAADAHSFKVGLNGQLAVTFLDSAAAQTDPSVDEPWSIRLAHWLKGETVLPEESHLVPLPFASLTLNADRGDIRATLSGEQTLSLRWPIYQATEPNLSE